MTQETALVLSGLYGLLCLLLLSLPMREPRAKRRATVRFMRYIPSSELVEEVEG